MNLRARGTIQECLTQRQRLTQPQHEKLRQHETLRECEAQFKNTRHNDNVRAARHNDNTRNNDNMRHHNTRHDKVYHKAAALTSLALSSRFLLDSDWMAFTNSLVVMRPWCVQDPRQR